MKTNPFGWIEIYVDDMERAKNFYQNVFEVNLVQLENPEVEIWAFSTDKASNGAPGALVKIEGLSAGKNRVIPYFTCRDCDTELSRVSSAGGNIHKPKFSIGEHGFIALFTDSEGNMIGLHSII